MKKYKRNVADCIMDIIDSGYHDRDDYPPYAITSWDDRNRFREYIRTILKELEASGELKYKKVQIGASNL